MAHLLEDWTAHGPAVQAEVRAKDPSTYLRAAFGTLPKDVAISFESRGPLDSEEGRYLRRLVDIITACAGDKRSDADARGKRFGRPERLDAGQKRVIAELYGKGKTIPELAAEYEVGVGTIGRALQPETSEAA